MLMDVVILHARRNVKKIFNFFIFFRPGTSTIKIVMILLNNQQGLLGQKHYNNKCCDINK